MNILARTRRAAIAIGCATALGLGIPAVASATPAQTATSGASVAQATAYQNQVISAAMRRTPGGVRISASEVRWANGVILKVMVSATAGREKSVRPDNFENCDAGYFCAINSPWRSMSVWDEIPNEILHHGPYFFPWGECSPTTEPGCDEGIHAYADNTGQRVWLEQNQDSGNELCITNHTYNLDFQGANSLDYWIYLSNNPNAC
jgi:hypothetical protein